MNAEIGTKLYGIFHPVAARQQADHKKNGLRFAHYTTAETALKIIRSGKIWMRSTACMSDYREVVHGKEQIEKFLADAFNQERFFSVFEKCSPGSAQKAMTTFQNWWESTRTRTFITCLTEHSGDQWDDDHLEDRFGRLSMWRAFGSGPNVAIVIDGNKIEVPHGYSTTMSPVAYHDEPQTNGAIHEVLNNVENNLDFLKSLPSEWIVGQLFNVMFYAVLCLKHPAFGEEREWRVIYSPDRHHSPSIVREERSVNGVPQTIHKFPVDLAAYLDRILIGPTQYESAIQDAIISELLNAKVPNALMKVYPTRIPIRTIN